MSKVADASRWFSLRVYRNGTTVNDGGLYVRDYKLVCLDESKKIETFGSETIAIKAVPAEGAEGELYIAEYDENDNLLEFAEAGLPNVVSVTRGSGTAKETLDYYYYRPINANAKSVRIFFWNNFEVMSETITLKAE